ncbi:MAG: peptidoglycan binding domain-containing protein [Clostridia bacterium]|nr:peptidoglycan binding domain-containing protein [Clostridia bacterium]
MSNKLNNSQNDNETLSFENEDEDVKINYSDFLKDTEEIEARLKKEEEERKKRIKEKIRKFEAIKPKADNNKKEEKHKQTEEDLNDINLNSSEMQKAEVIKFRIALSSIVVIVFIVLYLGISYGYYSSRFLPSTIINGENCSNKTVDEISNIMQERVKDYHLSIIYNDITVDELYGRDIDIDFGEMDKVLQDICNHQKKISWLKGFFADSEPISTGKGLTYDTSILNQFINSSLVLSMTSTIQSVNAGIEFSDGQYEITPAVYGDEINKTAVINKIIGAVNSLNSSLDINRDDCFIKPELTEDNKNLIKSCDKANKLIKNKIELNATDDLFEIPVDIKKDWFTVDAEGSLVFDNTAFAKYMDKVDKSYSENMEVREFKTFHGDTVSVTGGDFGTAIDRTKLAFDMEDAMFGGSDVRVVVEFVVTEKEIGSSYIEIDLSNQMMWMFVNGEQKLCTPVITGRDDGEHTTSEGVYRLKSKTMGGTVTEKGESKAVKYWMSINGETGICDAEWKNLFGGEVYKTEGSDGSIYVLEDSAKTIYENSYENMPIVCYNHAIVEDYFIEDSYMNELMSLIANKPEIPVYNGESEAEVTSEDVTNEEEVSQESSENITENDISENTDESNDTNSEIKEEDQEEISKENEIVND